MMENGNPINLNQEIADLRMDISKIAVLLTKLAASNAFKEYEDPGTILDEVIKFSRDLLERNEKFIEKVK